MCKVVKKKGTKTSRNDPPLKKDSVVYSIRFSVNNTRRLRDFMYADGGMKLLRKYNLFQVAGNIKIIKSGFLSYNEAKEKVHCLKLRSQNEWVNNYCHRGLKPINIPYSPDRSYKGRGWVSWKDWLGYDRMRKKRE